MGRSNKGGSCTSKKIQNKNKEMEGGEKDQPVEIIVPSTSVLLGLLHRKVCLHRRTVYICTRVRISKQKVRQSRADEARIKCDANKTLP